MSPSRADHPYRHAYTHPLSLRVQVALVVALLSFLPNLVMGALLFSVYYDPADDLRSGLSTALLTPLLLWLVMVGLLSAGIGYLLARQLLFPLSRLTEQVVALQRAARLPPEGFGALQGEPAEVGAFRVAFNTLIGQVNLEQTRRNAFMATLMHDLKTPLIAVNHLLVMVRDVDALARETRIDLVSRIVTENERLLELVQKMIDAHKFEREGVALERRACDLRPLVEHTLQRVRPLAEARALTLELVGEGHAWVDAREFERALYNLLSNAVRYARQRIRLEIVGDALRVSDDGPGLPAALEQLAQPFNAQPVEIAGQRYTAGTGGLGLFIARRIVEAHGGVLGVEKTGATGTTLLLHFSADGPTDGPTDGPADGAADEQHTLTPPQPTRDDRGRPPAVPGWLALHPRASRFYGRRRSG